MSDSIVHGGILLILCIACMFIGGVIKDWLNKRLINKYGCIVVGDRAYGELPGQAAKS